MTLHNKRPIIQLLLILLIFTTFTAFLTGCAKFTAKGEGEDKYTMLLNEATALMNKRKFLKAIEALNKASELDPNSPEPPYFSGRSYYRMGRYEEAVKSYEDALKRDKDYYSALHRLWAARLDMDGSSAEAKKRIKAEIEETLKKSGDAPGLMFAAYKGYYYINEKAKRLRLIRELAEKAEDETLKEGVASYFMEEVIGERKTKKRIELAETYIQNFPDARDIDIVLEVLITTAAKELKDKNEFLQYTERYLKKMKDNRSLNYIVSYLLVNKGLDLEKATILLEKNLNLIKDPSLNKAPEHMPSEEWKELLKRQESKYYSLLGWVSFKQGKRKKAKSYLERAKQLYERSDRLYYRLGRVILEDGDRKGAVISLKRSLEINDRLKDAKGLLRKLLEEEYDYRGEPDQFFAKKEGILTFTDITKKAGLGSVKAMRVAWGDYNNDGLEDLLLNGPRLFKNSGNGSFINVTEDAGIKGLKGFNGGVWGDFDNDGYLDIYLTSKKGNHLLKNNGSKGFNDITDEAFEPQLGEPAEAAAWGDYNNDGLLDLYVANMEKRGGERARCVQDRLWRNEGDGTFQDVTKKAGIKSDEGMCGRGVVWGDFNNDGFSDIMVSNYRLDPNFLWKNRGDSTFVDVAEEKVAQGREVDSAYGHTIGSVFGDIDNNGSLDLFSANLAHPRYIEFSDKSMVLVNSGSQSFKFSNTFRKSGVTYAETHSDPSFGDVDNDGDLDLYITSTYPGRNSFLYLNDGKGGFRDVSWLSGTRVKNGWGSAFADIDNDGDLDLVVASSEGIRLFRNNGSDNHFLIVKIRSATCNSFGIGSRVMISYLGRSQMREVRAGKGTGTQNSIPVEFGLGSYNGGVDIEVRTGCGDILKTRVEKPDRIVTM